jgi:hypothetical protein
MNTALTSFLLFSLCTSTAPISVGDTAPCTGIVWPVENTKNALKCKRVDLPTMTARWNLCEATKQIEINRLETKLSTAQDIINAAPDPAPRWILPAVSVGSFLAGALTVALLARQM